MTIEITFRNRKPVEYINIAEIAEVKHLIILSTFRGECYSFRKAGIKKITAKPFK